MGYILDMSEWQGDADFAKLAKIASLITLRVQAGSSHPDTHYQQYAAGCVANNIPFGSYAYGKFVSVNDAITESNDCFTRLHPKSQYVCVDVESVSTKNAADLVPATQAFIDNLKAKGIKKVGLYSGEYFYKAHNLAAVKADFLWLAKYSAGDDGTYNPACKPVTPCDLWQFTEKGHADGIAGCVDGSVLIGSKNLAFFTGDIPYKVVIPNLQYWQAKNLVEEFERRGFKCYGKAWNTYGPGETAKEKDPYSFIIETAHEEAVYLVIELKTRGYDQTCGEEIK